MGMHKLPAKARGVIAVRADASGDVNQILAALQKDWKSFKDTQAEKDKEVSAKFDDVITTEKMERINSSVSDLQAAVDQANAKMAALEMAGGPEAEKDPEYSASFKAHMRKGDVQASLNKGTDSEGGYLAPVEWDRTIVDRLVEISPMRQIAEVRKVGKSGFTKLINQGGTGSGWVGETDTRPETATPNLVAFTLGNGEIYANPGATQQMLDDSEIDLEAWLAGEVDTEFAEQEGAAFVAGNGSNKPSGFLSFATGGVNAGKNPLGAVEVLPAAGMSAVTEDELLDMIYDIPSSYSAGARFVMNRKSIGKIRKLRDADGRQLWQPSTQAGEPSMLLAYPLTELPDMPDMATGALSIGFGNFKRGYLIMDRKGVRVLRDPFTAKPKVLFYTTKRVGGAVDDPRGLRVLRHA
ncbi:phage major capsid protein [Pseudophaeobacter sp.]|uniref:phage major capsid protein n=1 Tax=Pseudophaeobacter sp. TaxID=1971739 RepID=UPI003A987D49